MRKDNKQKVPLGIREKALLLLEKKQPRPDLEKADERAKSLIFELELHQIELEMQNEELRTTHKNASTTAEKYIEYFDFAPWGYFVLSQEGEIIELNLSGANILCSNRLILKGCRFGFFITEETRPIFNLFLERIFQNRRSETCKLMLTPTNGNPICVYLSGITTERPGQCIVNVLHIANNLLEEQLLTANKALAFQNEEREKRAAELIVANTELAYQNEEKEKRAAELIITNTELTFQNEEKEKRDAELVVTNTELTHQNEEKEKLAAELIVTNTELAHQNEEKEKLAAELIIALNKAEQNDRLKTAFLGNMSHEIRTPLNSILGFSDLLKSEDITEEERPKFIEMIEQSGKRLLNIINNLIEISKIESGVTEVVCSTFNLNEKLDYIYTFFKTEIKKLGLELVFQNGLPFEAATIVSDREMLFTILINLVKNAIKYSDTGTIEFGYNLTSMDQQRVLQFYVKDTGIGIPAEHLEHIFNRFEQVDSDHTRLHEGNGLGLSIAKAYVELLGGKIWVESVLEKGSTFFFTLPYNTEPATTPDKEIDPLEETVRLSKRLNVLIVEDDELSELLLTRIVETYSQKMLYAKTGEEAITICRNNPDLDLILMDIRLPEKDGLVSTRQIREFNKEIIIIAQTAYALTGDKTMALAAGCNDYITKPINRRMLLEMIHTFF